MINGLVGRGCGPSEVLSQHFQMTEVYHDITGQ
jgi:hypothetical protein